MSWQAQAYAWSVENLNSTRKFVFLAIANRVGDSGCCWPSLDRLCKDTSLSERCVRDALRFLEGEGYLRSHKRQGTTTIYQVLLPSKLDLPQHDTQNLPDIRNLPTKSAEPRHVVPPTPAPDAPPPRHVVPPNLKDESIKKQREERACAREDVSVSFFSEGRFQREWAELPRPWAEYAAGCKLVPSETWDDFRDHFLSNGQPVHDWDARWRKWCREASKRQTEAVQAAGGDINPAYHDEWTPEKAREQEREYFERDRRREAAVSG